MTALENTEVSLALVFFQRLLAEQKEQDSLQAQNFKWSVGVMKKAFETYSIR